MEIVDKILKRVGTDKILHALVGALIVAWSGIFINILGGIIGWVITLILSVIKEYLDIKFDLVDILYAMIGATISLFLIILA